ncbi:hypothetical protein V1509DRAFT_89765 [Lipomyces kononenkoae]
MSNRSTFIGLVLLYRVIACFRRPDPSGAYPLTKQIQQKGPGKRPAMGYKQQRTSPSPKGRETVLEYVCIYVYT